MVKTETLEIRTQGNCHIINITDKVAQAIDNSQVKDGIVCVFNVGSTASISTIEFEPGLAEHDIEAALEKIAPKNTNYEHEKMWHDDNGHAHVRATLLGPSTSIPIVNCKMTLGTWQQIILMDFDTKARNREVICQIVGN